MSGRKRLAVFLSALWMTAWLVMYLVDYAAEFRWDGLFLFGVLPVALIWGVAWVVAGFQPKRAGSD